VYTMGDRIGNIWELGLLFWRERTREPLTIKY
jgi:hypothetical protein